jgi:hypothetical protein
MSTQPTEQSRCYDNTKLSGYKNCPRYHFIRQILGWRPEGTGAALVFGQAWHSAMDTVWEQAKKLNQEELYQASMLSFLQVWEEHGFPTDDFERLERMAPRTPGVAGEMLYHYIDQRWNMLREAEVLAIEHPVAVPLPDMDNFWYVGRLDKVVQWSSQKLVIEHKSTTAYATIGNFRAEYVDSWYTDSQVKGYEFSGGMYFPGLDGVWIDAALVHKKVHNAFKFIPVSHSFDILEEWVHDTKQWASRVSLEEDIYAKEGELLPGLFPKNENSCYGKYGACAFIDICRTVRDPSKLGGPPAGFVEDPWEPFSMLQLDKMVKEVDNA